MSIRQPFFPGKTVTSEFLNSGQYYGITNPGISFVANPINYWQYPLLDTRSIDYTDFSATFVTSVGNSLITGIKSFTSSPLFPTPVLGSDNNQAANTNFVNLAITTAFASNTFVDLLSTQTVTGSKTFLNLSVPLTANFPGSPISKDYADNNLVNTTTSQVISGEKVFASVVKVPTPISAGDAVNKAITDFLGNAVTSLQDAVAALAALAIGLTVTEGTYVENLSPCRFYWLKFGGNFKVLIVQGAGSANDTEVIEFPTTANNFPGYLQPPIVFTTTTSGDTGLFAAAVYNITSTGFSKAQDRFGGAAGQPLNYIAFGK